MPVPVPVELNLYEDLSHTHHRCARHLESIHYEIQQTTIAIRPLLSIEGIRFLFTSFVPNFQGFGALAVTLIAMMGAGVAEAAGLMAAADPQAGQGRPAR